LITIFVINYYDPYFGQQSTELNYDEDFSVVLGALLSHVSNSLNSLDPEIEIQEFVNGGGLINIVQMWNDARSGASKSVSIWRSNKKGYIWFDNSWWFSLGDIALTKDNESHGYSPPSAVHMMRATSLSWDSVFRAPDSYKLRWTDAGSGAMLDCSIWEPVCPPHFNALGNVATNGEYPPRYSVVCVKDKYTEVSEVIRGVIWNDRGSGAKLDVTLMQSGIKKQRGLSGNWHWISPGIFKACVSQEYRCLTYMLVDWNHTTRVSTIIKADAACGKDLGSGIISCKDRRGCYNNP